MHATLKHQHMHAVVCTAVHCCERVQGRGILLDKASMQFLNRLWHSDVENHRCGAVQQQLQSDPELKR